MGQVNIMGGAVMRCSQECRLANSLTQECTGGHNPDTTQSKVADADISACKEKIVYIGRIEGSIGNRVRCGGSNVRVGGALVIEAAGEMVIQGPAAKGDLIREIFI